MNDTRYFQSTDPVRRYIESQFDDTNNLSQSINNPLIMKLPDPLYVLYSLVLAFQQCDGMSYHYEKIHSCLSIFRVFLIHNGVVFHSLIQIFIIPILMFSLSIVGRHVICQIESKEDSSTTSTSMDMNSDGISSNGDQQSLMRPHPLHVKVTLILSRNYFL